MYAVMDCETNERKVNLCGGSLKITTSGRMNQTASRVNNSTADEKHALERQRKMDFLSTMPRKKSLQAFEPYVPPHRRSQSIVDQNNIEKSKQRVAKQSTSTSQDKHGSYYTYSKSEYSDYSRIKSYSDESSSNHNFYSRPTKSCQAMQNFLDFNHNFHVPNGSVYNSTKNNTVDYDLIVKRVLELINKQVNIGFKEILDGLYEKAYNETLPPGLLSTWKFSVTLVNDTECSVSNKKNELADPTKQLKLANKKTVPHRLPLESIDKQFWVTVHRTNICKTPKDVPELSQIIKEKISDICEAHKDVQEVCETDRETISKINETHKDVQESETCNMMRLSSVLSAPEVPENDYFDIVVLMSNDPSHFVVHLLRERTLSFNKMIMKMSEACKCLMREGSTLTSESIEVGQVYACKLTETDNCNWCRAYVTEIRDNTASVYCCDYGFYKQVSINKMVPLKKEFHRLPYQAIWAKLNGVKPTTMNSWSLRACLKFQELTESKNFVSRVVSKKDLKQEALEKHARIPLTKETIYSLDLVDTTTNDDIDIAKLLIRGGMADESD